MVVNNSMIVGTMEAIAEMLGIKFTGNTDDIYEAIAHLKESNLKMLKDRAKPAKINILPHLLAEALNLDNEFDDDGILNAIANLKHSLELSQNEVEDLREKSAIADQLQADLAHTDIGELRSERNYYRVILDKLCDRLNIADIESLEYAAKYQEMDLDFTAQHNDDLREKLVTSQAMALKYMKRIVELENEVRSLQEPVPTTAVFLSTPELVQIIRRLLD